MTWPVGRTMPLGRPDLGRIDFRVADDGQVYVIELNARRLAGPRRRASTLWRRWKACIPTRRLGEVVETRAWRAGA